MPSSEERLTALEVRLTLFSDTVDELKGDVKTLGGIISKLEGQLSVWRWLAPIAASLASSVATALIIRSFP